MGCCTAASRLSFKSGNIWAVDRSGTFGIIGGCDGTVEELEVFSSAAPAQDAAVEPSGGISLLGVALGDQCLLVANGGKRGIRCNGSSASFISGGVEHVESTCVHPEFHGRTVQTMNDHGSFVSGVHGNTAHLSDMRQRQNIRNGGWVKPHFTKVGEIPDKIGVLKSSVCYGAEDMSARSDVLQHLTVLKD